MTAVRHAQAALAELRQRRTLDERSAAEDAGEHLLNDWAVEDNLEAVARMTAAVAD